MWLGLVWPAFYLDGTAWDMACVYLLWIGFWIGLGIDLDGRALLFMACIVMPLRSCLGLKVSFALPLA